MEKVGSPVEAGTPLLLQLFNLKDLQSIQDAFSEATGLAAIMTLPDGTPVTKPSRFSRLCNMVRSHSKGRILCQQSDSVLGKGRSEGEGPLVLPCHSCGLLDAGSPVYLNGIHIGSWMIGQVRNERTDMKHLLEYTDSLGLARKEVKKAYNAIPAISFEQFSKIADALFLVTEQLSREAYQNLKLNQLMNERAAAAEKLQAENERVEALIKAVPDLLAEIGRDGTVLNLISDKDIQHEFVKSRLTNRNISDILPPEDAEKLLRTLSRVFDSETVQLFHYSSDRSGRHRDYEIRLVQAGPDKALALVRDMSDYYRVTRELEQKSEEKDLLIKELFHRTKNSLQIVRSFISLQEENQTNPEVKEALKTAEVRILSMAAVHQKMYELDNLETVPLNEYLPDLVYHIFSLLENIPGKVHALCTVPPIEVMIDVAIPIGLIINELVSNALRHSFPSERAGYVKVTLKELPEERLEIVVENNGRVPEEDFFLKESNSLGITTIKALVNQLEGTVSAEIGEGLKVRAVVKNTGYQSRLFKK